MNNMNLQKALDYVAQEVITRIHKEIAPCISVIAHNHGDIKQKLDKNLAYKAHYVFYGDTCDKPIQRHILPYLSCNSMADMVMGKADGIMQKEVMYLLRQGIIVEVLDYEFTTFCSTATKALYDLYVNHQQKLISFGLIPLQTNIAQNDFSTLQDLPTLIAEALQQETKNKSEINMNVMPSTEVSRSVFNTGTSIHTDNSFSR